MSQTSPKSKPQAPPEVPETTFTASAWAAGDGAIQVPLAGLLIADPELQTATLTSTEWTKRLGQYLRSERP